MKNEIFFPSFKMVFLKDQLWIGYKMSVGENKKKKKNKTLHQPYGFQKK